MGVLKGLVLSGGKGTRLRPFTFTAAKQLVPIANKPVLFYVLEDLVLAGITEIGIIVGDTEGQIRDAVGDGSRFGARITYIPQLDPLGLAHAVLTAEHWLAGDRFVMYLGDNFLRDGIAGHVRDFQDSAADASLLLKRVDHPEQFGVAILEEGRVVRLIEKPPPAPEGQRPVSDLALVGVYMFGPEILEAARNIKPSRRGELEITDAISWLMDNGYDVRASVLEDHWIDTGKMEDLLEANRLVLERLTRNVRGNIDQASSIVGEVWIGAGARIENSVLRGPLSIESGTEVVDSYIGPFTAIGRDCIVDHCEIQHSIVMEHSIVQNIPTPIESSVIGRYVRITRVHRRPHAFRLSLGDYSSAEVP